MNAYHVLEEFYSFEISKITTELEERFQQLAAEGLSPIDIQIELVGYRQRLEGLKDYKNQILERHLYGLDLDPQAAELAAVNLMLRAMTRDMRLPLILSQNIKVGNALLSGTPLRGMQAQKAYASFAGQLAELRRLRLAQQGIAQDVRHPIELQGEFERLASEVNNELNQCLSDYFEDGVSTKRPFNWIVEYPEVFLDETGNLRKDGGFTFVIGNPPYLSIDDTWGRNSPDAEYLKHAFSDIWAGKSDIYYYFIRRALALLVPYGQLGFITARYYLEAYYASNLRQIMLNEAAIQQVVDFGDYTVFVRVGTKTSITLLQRETAAQIREDNHLLFDRALHKNIDVLAFLNTFGQTAHSFSQAGLDADSWNLYGQSVAQVIQKIDDGATPLGELTFIGQGMQTGRNPVFAVDRATLDRYQIEPELIRKNIKNQDITPYNLGFRGLYLIYPEEIESLDDYPYTKVYLEEHRDTLEKRAAFQRGDCEWWRFTWPLHQERYNAPKIITPYIAPENRFALDTTTEFIGLTDTTVIFAKDNSPDLRYLLALLNSKLLNFRYQFIGKAKDYRYEYFENGIAKIPIRFTDEATTQKIVTLAQRMLDLHFIRQTLFDEFAEALNATIYTTRDFYRAYFNHSEYKGNTINRVGSVDANSRGTVTGITIVEQATHLVIRITEEEASEISLITLDIPDDDFRRFLLLAVRAELFENHRKQIWVRGRLLQGTLQALQIPVLVGASASANIMQIHELMEEVRQCVTSRVNEKLKDRSTQFNDLLALGNIESEIANIDRRLNELVYGIYNIRSQEELQLIDSVLSS